MSKHTEQLHELLTVVVESSSAAAFVIGWFASNASEQELQDVIQAARTVERGFGSMIGGVTVERFSHPSRLD